ncbi:hypothetical protein D3C75_904910 [compost metagenome]
MQRVFFLRAFRGRPQGLDRGSEFLRSRALNLLQRVTHCNEEWTDKLVREKRLAGLHQRHRLGDGSLGVVKIRLVVSPAARG